jgi:hypothetical protein
LLNPRAMRAAPAKGQNDVLQIDMEKRTILSAYLITSIAVVVAGLLLDRSHFRPDALAKPECVEVLELMETKGVIIPDIQFATWEPPPIGVRIISVSFFPSVCIGVFAAVLVLLEKRTRGKQKKQSNRGHTARTQFEHAHFHMLQIDRETRTILRAYLITFIAFSVIWIMVLLLEPSLFNHFRLAALAKPERVEILELMETKGVTVRDIAFATWEPPPIGVQLWHRSIYWFLSPSVYIGSFVAVLVLLERRTRRKQNKKMEHSPNSASAV